MIVSIWLYYCNCVINVILYAKYLVQWLNHRKLYINKSYYDDNDAHDENDDKNKAP